MSNSLIYLNKTLKKAQQNKQINIPLINTIGSKFFLGNGYLINPNITYNDTQQINRIVMVLNELIDKITKEINTTPLITAPPTPPTPTGSSFTPTGSSSTPSFTPPTPTPTGSSSTPTGSSSTPTGSSSTSSFTPPTPTGSSSTPSFTPPHTPPSKHLYIVFFLQGQNIMDNNQRVINPNGLKLKAYRLFVNLMNRKGLTQHEIDNYLNHLGVKIPPNIKINTSAKNTLLDLDICKKRLETFLKDENILDVNGKILNNKGLSKKAFDKFRNKNLDLTTTQINDCLMKLNVKLNTNPILREKSTPAPFGEVLLNKIKCTDILRKYLIRYNVMDARGDIIDPDGLLAEQMLTRTGAVLNGYDMIVEDLSRKNPEFTLNVIDDCLNQLGVTLPS